MKKVMINVHESFVNKGLTIQYLKLQLGFQE